MAATITVPVTGIDDITCPGGAILTPAAVRVRYDRREQPDITVSGPTRYADDGEPSEHTFDFSFCTCRKWLADLVEHHRPAGYRGWEHGEATAWEVIVGRWINVRGDTPDPHREETAANEAALDDVGDCEVLRLTLTQALYIRKGTLR